MSYVSIPNLPMAVALDGTEQIEVVQAGTSRRSTISAIASSAVAIRANNAVQFSTYTALAATTNMVAGDRATVASTDVGTHTDPVVGGVVNNTGVYTYSSSPAGWQRIDSLDSVKSAISASGAATSASGAATSAATATTKATSTAADAVSTRADLLGVQAALVGYGGALALPVTTRTLMAGLTTTPAVVYLQEANCQGIFQWDPSNLSAMVTIDTNQGVYVAPTSATTGVSGAWVRAVPQGRYNADWWLGGSRTLVQDKINQALKIMPAGSTLFFPPGNYTVARAIAGSVTPGSVGIISAIYIDKDNITLEGSGWSTVIDGANGALNLFEFRANNGVIRHFKAGNVSGQLYNNESAPVSFTPSNFVGGTGAGVNIENLLVENCWFYDFDSGVTAHPDQDLAFAGEPMFLASGLTVRNCRFVNFRRQCIELFQTNRSRVHHNYATGADKGVYVLSRFVRVIGSLKVAIHDNDATGFSSTTNGYIAVQLETAGYNHRPPYFEDPAGVDIHDNRFRNFTEDLRIDNSRGIVNFIDNDCWAAQNTAANFCVRINTGLSRDETVIDPSILTNKNEAVVVNIHGNTCVGKAKFFLSQGRMRLISIKNNKFAGNNTTETALIDIARTTTGFNESIGIVRITGNTAIMNPAASASGVVRIADLNSDAWVEYADNRVTADSGGAILTQDGTGVLFIPNRASNQILPAGLWASDFNPPRGNVSTVTIA